MEALISNAIIQVSRKISASRALRMKTVIAPPETICKS